MRVTVSEIVFDCADPAALARFWAGLLGGEPVDREPDWSYVDPPGFVRVAFQRVPEGKAVKNRLHLDLEGGDVEAAAERAVALGAVRAGGLVRDAYGTFRVMRDPEGNEFCFVSG
ncbi:VOC family protein [Streptomyces somaliensis DSM 40738]|uniref:VOC family protein n=1 Tax=Streptomyces somaliensis (strain ATCC 33201 / DSM 40738 / JCM 12659 / KCTC 9044 / NCTC 11332 / NRRL B-12077 / IP 733) TaxID=1134445 RepID=A0AA44DEP3_STRE0|nr:VOC family protein [Streptomyces somaliensis]MCQ0021771.1 VOC family protein [Streptomyces somaliensis DSM 40738]NKY15030.1 VOC family protein [Streptomyces somaliensis DSM 40738]